MNRRNFLKTIGLGAVVTAIPPMPVKVLPTDPKFVADVVSRSIDAAKLKNPLGFQDDWILTEFEEERNFDDFCVYRLKYSSTGATEVDEWETSETLAHRLVRHDIDIHRWGLTSVCDTPPFVDLSSDEFRRIPAYTHYYLDMEIFSRTPINMADIYTGW